MSDWQIVKHNNSFGQFTFRRFLSHILHEGFDLEVVICEIVFHKTHSEHDTGDFAALNRWAQIRSLCHPSVWEWLKSLLY